MRSREGKAFVKMVRHVTSKSLIGVHFSDDNTDLLNVRRLRVDRSSSMLLQSPQSLPTTPRSDLHLRQDRSQGQSHPLPTVSCVFRLTDDVQQPVLDILAEMIAADSTISVGPFGAGPGSDSGAAAVE